MVYRYVDVDVGIDTDGYRCMPVSTNWGVLERETYRVPVKGFWGRHKAG